MQERYLTKMLLDLDDFILSKELMAADQIPGIYDLLNKYEDADFCDIDELNE